MTRPGVHFVIGAYEPSVGGAQVHTAALASALLAEGVKVRVSCLWRTTRTDWVLGSTIRLPSGRARDETTGVTVDECGLLGSKTILDRIAAAGYYLLRPAAADYFASRIDYDAGDEDVVHIIRLGREHLALRALEEARESGRPVVLTPNHHPRWSGRRDPIWRKIYREVDHVFALTEHEKGLLIELGIQEERITVTGVGPVLPASNIDSAAMRKKYRLPTAPYIAFLGQQYRYKRLDVAVGAFDQLAVEFPDLMLVIAGPTSQRTLELRRASPFSSRIHVLGILPDREKVRFLGDAAVLVFPSTQESFGGVLIEAASVGTPFVTSDIPQLQEVSRTIGGGTCVTPTASGFAEALGAILGAEGKLRDDSGVSARIQHRYSWQALALVYRRIYDELTADS